MRVDQKTPVIFEPSDEALEMFEGRLELDEQLVVLSKRNVQKVHISVKNVSDKDIQIPGRM